MTRILARVARMPPREIAWRASAAARIQTDRWRTEARGSRWDRRRLLDALSEDRGPADVRTALAAKRWGDAHAALTRHFLARSPRFVLAHAAKRSLTERIQTAWPAAAAGAADAANRVLEGRYDLLGYSALRFGNASMPDWHYDPVHDRRAPRRFWSTVPYLDPRDCGDHKIIWELNRHQHWMALGRAYWLTGHSAYRDRAIAELSDWLDANPPLVGINWASMLELSFRALSWLWAMEFFLDEDAGDPTPWLVDLLLALDRQLTHIERNLSLYFSPNTHLLGEALALYVAGRVLPELGASPRREALGRKILLAESRRQIAGDGGHCERSTHYHRYTLDFYLLALAVARLTGDPVAADFNGSVLRLAGAARLLADDRGHVPRLGDDDGGALWSFVPRARTDLVDTLAIAAVLTNRRDLAVADAPEQALWVIGHPALAAAADAAPAHANAAVVGSAALPDTGYFVSRAKAGHHVVIDGGPHGYQNAGHAHADALSMTLSIAGEALLIDPGTGCYTVDSKMRDRFRSTAAHNTVEIDGHPQSVPHGPFHWRRTADSRVHRWRTADGMDYFDGSHSGYLPTEHRRRVVSLHGEAIVVADLVEGAGAHSAAAHWHLAPDWRADVDGGLATLTRGERRLNFAVSDGRIERFVGDERTGLGWWSPAYGRVEPTTTLRVICSGRDSLWMVSVFDLVPHDPVRGLELLPLWTEAGSLRHGTGVRIVRESSIDYAIFAESAEGREGARWRVADIETDARMAMVRVNQSGAVVRVALADGSFLQHGHGGSGLMLGRTVRALYLDERRMKDAFLCVASQGS